MAGSFDPAGMDGRGFSKLFSGSEYFVTICKGHEILTIISEWMRESEFLVQAFR